MSSMNRRSMFSMAVISCASMIAWAQVDSLRPRIEQVVALADGRIGVAVQPLETMDTLAIHGDARFPMQSVYKFPLALAVLSRVDQGTLSLRQRLHLTKNELRPNTWSPLRERYPNGTDSLTLDDVLRYTVSESDNNGCDILFRLLGGTSVVDHFIHRLGIRDISIVATEEEMAMDRQVQYRNWSSPAAMAHLLSMFYRGNILSRDSRDHLLKLMTTPNTSPVRLQGILPKEAIVAHKTGSSGADSTGLAAATNDVGIMTLPHARHVIVVVFVSDSRAAANTRDQYIARIGKIVWDVFAGE